MLTDLLTANHSLVWDRTKFDTVSQWMRSLRCGFAPIVLLGLWVQIPLGAWMSVSYKYCVLSGRGLVTCPEESYWVWCAWVWSWSLNSEEARAQYGLLRHLKKIILFISASMTGIISMLGKLPGNGSIKNEIPSSFFCLLYIQFFSRRNC
jgi:hypothetical protein